MTRRSSHPSVHSRLTCHLRRYLRSAIAYQDVTKLFLPLPQPVAGPPRSLSPALQRPCRPRLRGALVLQRKLNRLVNSEEVLAAVCVGGGEEVGEEALDEGEHQHVADGRERDDEDDDEGHKSDHVLERPPQRPHLSRLKRHTQRRLQDKFERVLHVGPEQLATLHVEAPAVGDLASYLCDRDFGEDRERVLQQLVNAQPPFQIRYIPHHHGQLFGIHAQACQTHLLFERCLVVVLLASPPSLCERELQQPRVLLLSHLLHRDPPQPPHLRVQQPELRHHQLLLQLDLVGLL
mmetsp:Transcript_26467/g.53795  ORF Transcript_26467/g.53795 Transcript_26467/m.53795 type:complete len:292 (+) Transcript_26467:24-899(+)